ncbi:hypothetical protein SMA90_33855, partial [Escherichia coli]
CHRSEGTYGRTEDRPLFTRVLIACSGAVIDDLYLPHGEHRTADGEVWPSQLEQLDQLEGPIDAVLLSIGGNDVGFADIIKACILS